MKKLIVFSLAYVLLISCSKDNPTTIVGTSLQLESVQTYGGTRNESAQSVISTSDGGYIVLGHTQSIDGDVITTKTTVQFDVWVLRFNAKNELLWQKTLGGSKDDKAFQIINTNDGGFAIVGQSKSNDGDLTNNEGFEDVWLIKLDANGTILWNTTTGFSGTDQGLSVIQTSDGGYFLGSILDVTASGGLGNSRAAQRHAGGDFWGIKLSSSGAIEWRKYFGGSNTDTCYDVIETSDGYLMIGSSDSNDVDIKNNKGSYDFWLVKINKTGVLQWEKSLGGSQIDEAYQIVKTTDNNYLIIGETRSSDKDVANQKGGADLWLVKIDASGNILWEKTYGGSGFDVGRAITKTNDNNFLIVGSSRSSDNQLTNNQGQNDAWILKVDTSGNLLSQISVGGAEVDFGYDITELLDGSIIAIGESNSSNGNILSNKGFSDLMVIKLKQ